MLKLSKPVALAIVFSSLSLLSCANNPGTASTATAASGASAATLISSTSSGASSANAATFTITQVSPPAGALNSVPNPIEVVFSGSSVDSVTGSAVGNYTLSCSNGVYYPSTVSVTGNYAMLNFPNLTTTSAGASCTLSVSANVKDGSGDFLSGTRTTSYTLGTAVSPTADVTAPVGSISSPSPSDRLYGSVSLGAYAYDTGANQSGVASVKFLIDGTTLGTVTSSPYAMSFNTASFQNGAHTISIDVTDKAGNVASAIDNRAITIANYAYTVTLAAGGSGGGTFTDSAPAENVLMGLQARADSYVEAIQPVYQNAFGSDIVQSYGGWHGGGGTAAVLQCPPGYLVTGLTGWAGQYVDNIALICMPASGQGSSWTGPSIGGSGGSAFTITCPANKFVTKVLGRSGSYIDQIQLGCQ